MHPIRVGIVGTGYAAKARAESLQADFRAQLVAVAGRTLENAQAFAAAYDAQAVAAWPDLLSRDDIDLIVIASINSDHGLIAKAALQAQKHVVVEYPLALDLAEAEALCQMAQVQNRLLHVEHIELLSGIHQAVQAALPELGTPFYVNYTNLNPQRPAPAKWTYSLTQFGFPLIGALSRVHRLTHLFGQVATVSCRASYWPAADRFASCLVTAQLQFVNGLVGEVVYGKGETIWQAARTLTIHGERGAVVIDRDEGTLVLPDQTRKLEMGSRRGLFARDTAMVLDHLTTGALLYVSLADSLYALKVADAARRSAATATTIRL